MAIDRETQVLTTAYANGIRSRRELANYMAQVTHESNGLNRLQESFRYMRGVAQIPVQAAWRDGPQVLDAARKEALLGRPEKLAELMYGGRNGNNQPGDGYRYHGRGYLPVPGKDHYRAAGKALGLDLVARPELAAEPEHAASIAAWYWKNRVPQSAREDVKSATEALNGKLYGLDDRRTRFESWERRLSPELMQRLEEQHAGQTISTATIATATLEARQHGAKKKLRREADNPLMATDAMDDMVDPLLTFEMQRDIMEATTEYVPEPQRHRHHRHHPHPSLQHANHPQNALYTQAREAVHRLDDAHARQPDDNSDKLAAALTVAAHGQGMDRIDHVTLNDDASRAYAVQGDLHSPHKLVAEVHTEHALNTSLEQSTADLSRQVPTPTHEPAAQQPHVIKPVPSP